MGDIGSGVSPPNFERELLIVSVGDAACKVLEGGADSVSRKGREVVASMLVEDTISPSELIEKDKVDELIKVWSDEGLSVRLFESISEGDSMLDAVRERIFELSEITELLESEAD